jgi:hypothetical protein
MGKEYFEKYRETGDFDHIIRLYDTDSPFYLMIRDDETFLVEMYKQLFQYGKHIFQGRTYRGLQLLPNDFAPYQWALAHPKSLIEMRELIVTSQNKQIATRYIGEKSADSRGALFEMEFTEQCFTVIDVSSWSMYQEEKEVFVLSGTFFEVTGIREGDKGLTIISLKNVCVDKSISSVLL